MTGPSNSFHGLPPPPSRARKIIQMKPKTAPSPDSDASYQPPASAAPASHTTTKAPGTSTNSKRKQPATTSAAGRKIARKTAHSIIERRRRSKMNEEFGVLKDMIPACEGVEMHKLAILQAGIEYVRYLEGCVSQLSAKKEKQGHVSSFKPQVNEQAEGHLDEQDEGEDEDDQEDILEEELDPAPPTRTSSGPRVGTTPNDWTFRDSRKSSMASLSSASYPSPHILARPNNRIDDQGGGRNRPNPPAEAGPFSASPPRTSTSATSAAPSLTTLSPALNSIHFSPDLARTQTNSSMGRSTGSVSFAAASTTSSWTTVNPSPNMPPLPSPKATMHLPLPHPVAHSQQLPQPSNAVQHNREAHSKSPAALSDMSATEEATAGAALMMLTNEWRGTASAGTSSGRTASGDAGERGKAMSVRDLLSS